MHRRSRRLWRSPSPRSSHRAPSRGSDPTTTGRDAGPPSLEIIQVLPDAVLVIEAGGLLAWMNRAAEDLLGRPADEVVGKPASDVVFIPDGSGGNLVTAAPVGRRLPFAKGLPERDCEIALAHGRFVPVSLRCAYDKDARHVVRRVVCTLRDTRARRGMDMRTAELISTVSHEIRSPLTSVKGFTKTLLDRWDRFDDDMKKEMLTAVNQDADRVTRLLGELLDVSRLEAGRLRLRAERLQLRDLAEKVVGKLRDRSDRHTIEVAFSRGVPKVLADADKVEQVLTNLVENALKYTPGGTVRVTGRKRAETVCVSVSDEGDGIPSALVARMFRKFARRELPGSPTGTGLGLYIAKGIIEAHGGEMGATSVLGQGTTFTFCIPVRAPST